MRNLGGLACSLLVVLAGCTTSAGSEAGALAAVDAAYASFNEGDTDTWVELLERGSYYESEDRRAWAHDLVMDVMSEQVDGGAQYETVDCESRGRGSWDVAHPELNPVEYIWSYLKRHEVVHFCPHDFAELTTFARRRLASMQRRSNLVASFWKQAELAL